MAKKDIIKILRNYKNEVANQYNILTIGIFGSVARGEAGDESDIDIVVRISEPDFFMLAGIKDDLEKRLNNSVDIVTYRDSMNPFLKRRIDSEAVYA
ncbi:MAG: nucleotidyltransferase family protein [Desulfobacula sp.]|nr:nucleotidyltransferase family protein [Desulfobacula sp.]